MTAEVVGFHSTASSEVLNQITNSLNISKLNDSVVKDKESKLVFDEHKVQGGRERIQEDENSEELG
jgi:hypothetical protein